MAALVWAASGGPAQAARRSDAGPANLWQTRKVRLEVHAGVYRDTAVLCVRARCSASPQASGHAGCACRRAHDELGAVRKKLAAVRVHRAPTAAVFFQSVPACIRRRPRQALACAAGAHARAASTTNTRAPRPSAGPRPSYRPSLAARLSPLGRCQDGQPWRGCSSTRRRALPARCRGLHMAGARRCAHGLTTTSALVDRTLPPRTACVTRTLCPNLMPVISRLPHASASATTTSTLCSLSARAPD
jgi:hypothetical protein